MVYHILRTKITVAKNEVVLSYHRERRLYFLSVIFAMTIVISHTDNVFAAEYTSPAVVVPGLSLVTGIST